MTLQSLPARSSKGWRAHLAMYLLMARRAQHNKMTRIVTVEQITGKMDGMELQRLVVLSTCRANRLSLFTQRPLQPVHLCDMHQV
jgi:hypothetical protein